MEGAKMTELTPEERAAAIAKELAWDGLNREDAQLGYYFKHKNKTVTVEIKILPPSLDPHLLYVTLGAPGTACTCCGGSGKTPPKK